MEQDRAINARPQSAGGTVDGDVHCRTCGYNLRTLRIEGKCPECGEAVSMSLRDMSLRAADDKLLSMVRMGLAMSMAGCLVWSLEEFAAFAPPFARLPLAKLNSIAFVLMAAGAWAICPVASVELLRPVHARHRGWMRWLFTAALALHLVDWLLVTVGHVVLARYYSRGAGMAIILCCAIAIGLQIHIIEAWAREIPDMHLAKWAHICKWCVPVSAAIYEPVVVGIFYSRTAYLWLRGFFSLAVLDDAWQTTVLLRGIAMLASGVVLAWTFKVVHQHMQAVAIRAGQSTAGRVPGDGKVGKQRPNEAES